MKTVVSVQEISEFDIKPRGMVGEWRSLVEGEIARRWVDRRAWVRVDWPTCAREDTIPAFERYGLAYVECQQCGSLYAPLRPDEKEIWGWYRESAPAVFWREHLLSASAEARTQKMTRPRADWVLDGMAEYVPSARRLVDISAWGRALIDVLAAENRDLGEIVAAGMTADLEGGAAPRIQVEPTHIARLPELGPADVVVAVDAFDRTPDLAALVNALELLLAPGGVLFATAPVASGFEIQTLWERSPTIIPPDKLNLPTVEALQRMFALPTWQILELSTPGMFDVEMVYRAMEAEPEGPWPRVVRSLVQKTELAGRTALVELLQSQRLTSFARLVVRRNA